MKRFVPPNIANCMNPVDRKENGITTQAEDEAKFTRRHELREQKLFVDWLYKQEREGWLVWNRARPDKPSTIRKGWPDFSIYSGEKTIFIEMKAPGCEPTREQYCFQQRLEYQGFRWFLAFTAAEAIDIVRIHCKGPPR